jgi:hypothetical protein
VPTRKVSVSVATDARRAPQRTARAREAGILARRDRLVAEVALLRRRGEPSKFIDNAEQLLTRWWSRASWNAREELLKSADWLVRLEKRRELGVGYRLGPPGEASAKT